MDSDTSSLEDYILLDSTIRNEIISNNITNKIGIHPINRKRGKYGEFHHLYEDLKKDPQRFFEYMRMSPSTFFYIRDKIQSKISKTWKNCHSLPIGLEERLMLTLRYLSTGASFRSLAFTFRMGKSTVANIVSEVVPAIWEMLQPAHLRIPNPQDFKNIAEDFDKIWNFPHCVGALDGKHIRINCPEHSGSHFYNYKNFFSIVLQALVDANYKFINIDVGGYGRQSDGGTFRASPLYEKLMDGSLNLPEDEPFPGKRYPMPYVMVADEAYPLLKHLLKPYSRQDLNPDNQYFNRRLSRARKTVECAFGILVAKWEILRRPIATRVELADSIVKCVCVLHNTIIDLEGIDHNLSSYDMSYSFRSARQPIRGRQPSEAKLIRESFKEFICQNPIMGD